LPLQQQGRIEAGMPLRRCDEVDGTVAVLVVVPAHEASDPAPGCREIPHMDRASPDCLGYDLQVPSEYFLTINPAA
jgi:hypothetical protein